MDGEVAEPRALEETGARGAMIATRRSDRDERSDQGCSILVEYGFLGRILLEPEFY